MVFGDAVVEEETENYTELLTASVLQCQKASNTPRGDLVHLVSIFSTSGCAAFDEYTLDQLSVPILSS